MGKKSDGVFFFSLLLIVLCASVNEKDGGGTEVEVWVSVHCIQKAAIITSPHHLDRSNIYTEYEISCKRRQQRTKWRCLCNCLLCIICEWVCGRRRYGYKIQLFSEAPTTTRCVQPMSEGGNEGQPNRFKRSAHCSEHSRRVMAIVMAVRCNAMHKMQCYASAFMHMCKCMRPKALYSLFMCAHSNSFIFFFCPFLSSSSLLFCHPFFTCSHQSAYTPRDTHPVIFTRNADKKKLL